MLLKLIPCLALVVILVSEVTCQERGVFCQKWNEDCTLVNPNCCEGMKCKHVAGGYKCREWGSGGMCKTRGQLCSQGLNNGCCPGLSCKSKILHPNVHECR